ncbi:MAG: deoxyribose-phosphate aldolase [Acholeplasmataceae bacterium]
MELNKMIDHTKLGPTVTREDIDKLIEEAKTYGFKSVCVDPIWVPYCQEALEDTDVLVCTVIGFPHGTHTINTKIQEAEEAVQMGADELDMVINVYQLRQGNEDYVRAEIAGVLKKANGRTVKVIIETCYLTAKEITLAAKLVAEAGAQFVKTSTGFGSGGARVEDVELMKEAVKDRALVKASGGVRTYEDAVRMVEAGASRIGTSSGVNIVTEGRKQSDTNTAY